MKTWLFGGSKMNVVVLCPEIAYVYYTISQMVIDEIFISAKWHAVCTCDMLWLCGRGVPN